METGWQLKLELSGKRMEAFNSVPPFFKSIDSAHRRSLDWMCKNHFVDVCLSTSNIAYVYIKKYNLLLAFFWIYVKLFFSFA